MPRVFLGFSTKDNGLAAARRALQRLRLWILTRQLTTFVPFGLFFLLTEVQRVYYKIVKVIKSYHLAGKNSLKVGPSEHNQQLTAWRLFPRHLFLVITRLFCSRPAASANSSGLCLHF